MFKLFKKKSPISTDVKTLSKDESFNPRPEFIPGNQPSEVNLLKKQVADQEVVLRDLVIVATWIANNKRFEHIQDKLIKIHNKLDEMIRK